MCPIFILLGSNNLLGAQQKNNQNRLFERLSEKIQQKKYCAMEVNPSKSAALVSVDCGSVDYINFKTKQVYVIASGLPNLFITWLSNDIAHIQSPCGTGCSNSMIFAAPKTVLTCPIHEYRIKNLNENEPPDYYNNTPLLINPKKRVYACYNEKNEVHTYSLPPHYTS